MSFQAEIVADSINEYDDRITSMLITFPRYILAELNTHRAFSRNSASSRAIPFNKMVKMVETHPFVPLKWMKDHSGMQGIEYFTEPHEIKSCIRDWEEGKDRAIGAAKRLQSPSYYASDCHREGSVTKQIANRMLEPFMWHKVLVTATHWENFTALRFNTAADIHMQIIAELILSELNRSEPKSLKAGEWHIPFGDLLPEDLQNIPESVLSAGGFSKFEMARDLEILRIKMATARSAQTSYSVIGENRREIDCAKLVALHDRLFNDGHMSPFEHCARTMTLNEYDSHVSGVMTLNDHLKPDITKPIYGWCGNFKGFIQYRKMIPNENRRDGRLIKKTYEKSRNITS